MGRPAVETIVNLLDGERSNPDQILPVSSPTFDRHFYDALEERAPWMVRYTTASVVAGDWEVTLPKEATRLVCGFWDEDVLTVENRDSVHAYGGEDWRNERGAPLALVTENERSLQRFRIYPIPDRAGTLRLLYEAADETDIPVYLEVPLALEVLRMEMGAQSAIRESSSWRQTLARVNGLISALVA